MRRLHRQPSQDLVEVVPGPDDVGVVEGSLEVDGSRKLTTLEHSEATRSADSHGLVSALVKFYNPILNNVHFSSVDRLFKEQQREVILLAPYPKSKRYVQNDVFIEVLAFFLLL